MTVGRPYPLHFGGVGARHSSPKDALVSHLLLLWAKLGQADFAERHPIVCHLLDVASVALRLWDDALHDALKKRLAASLGLPPDHAGRWLAFWAGAHDIGKVSP